MISFNAQNWHAQFRQWNPNDINKQIAKKETTMIKAKVKHNSLRSSTTSQVTEGNLPRATLCQPRHKRR